MTKSTGRSRLAAQFDAVTSQDMGFDDATAPWMNWMLKHLNEIQQTGSKPTPFTVEVFNHTTYPPLGNYTPESCAATVCAALEETDYASTHNASAASYATYGTPCELKPGCIVVFSWPDGGHHVNFCHDIIDDNTFRGLGGNQSHSRKTVYHGDALAGEADSGRLDLAADRQSFANASRQASCSPRPSRPGHGQIRSDDGASAAARKCRLVFEGPGLGCDGQ